jgi:cobalt-zinc-cadmium resistance protein CzcA
VKQQLDIGFANAMQVYIRNTQLLHSYQSSLLPNASTIIKTATQKLSAGEIGYLDWVIHVNQALQIRSEYLNTVQQLNDAAFEIEKLSAIN